MLNLKAGETLLTEEQLANHRFNERSANRYAVNTVLDFTNVQYAVKTTKNGDFLIFFGTKINAEGVRTEDYRIPASMILRAPWNEKNREALRGHTALQDQILDCLTATNPGLALKNLLKGKRIRVVKNVTAKDTPFGKTAEEDMDFNIFDWA